MVTLEEKEGCMSLSGAYPKSKYFLLMSETYPQIVSDFSELSPYILFLPIKARVMFKM